MDLYKCLENKRTPNNIQYNFSPFRKVSNLLKAPNLLSAERVGVAVWVVGGSFAMLKVAMLPESRESNN